MAILAVSARSIRDPSVTVGTLYEWNKFSSDGVKPPSGPIKAAIEFCVITPHHYLKGTPQG